LKLDQVHRALLDLSSYVDSLTKQIEGTKAGSDTSNLSATVTDLKLRLSGINTVANDAKEDIAAAKLEAQNPLLATLADEQASLAKVTAAIDEADKSIASIPPKVSEPVSPAHALWQAGFDLSRTGNAKGARDKYQAALKANPNYAPALNSLGVLEYGDGNYAAADALFQKTLATTPNYAAAQANHALVLLKLGDRYSARTAAQTALKNNPGYAPAIQVLSELDKLEKADPKKK